MTSHALMIAFCQIGHTILPMMRSSRRLVSAPLLVVLVPASNTDPSCHSLLMVVYHAARLPAL